MRALKPWKPLNFQERTYENHLMLRRLEDIDKRQFMGLQKQLKEFKRHEEIVRNRRKWFEQARFPKKVSKSVASLSKR